MHMNIESSIYLAQQILLLLRQLFRELLFSNVGRPRLIIMWECKNIFYVFINDSSSHHFVQIFPCSICISSNRINGDHVPKWWHYFSRRVPSLPSRKLCTRFSLLNKYCEKKGKQRTLDYWLILSCEGSIQFYSSIITYYINSCVHVLALTYCHHHPLLCAGRTNQSFDIG